MEIERSVHAWGEKIFGLMEQTGPPSLFTKKGIYGALMEWAMKDAHFKTQLFRFVDVLPVLNSSAEVARHLREYLSDDGVKLAPAIRAALSVSTFAGGLLSGGIRSQVTAMARQFMLGNDEREILSTLKLLNEDGIAFTVDILGETVVSEPEADNYAARYLELLNRLASETSGWRPCASNQSAIGEVPRLNISIKVSALYSQIQPNDPETAISKLSNRLRPILRRAKELSAFINFDMESYALKDLTLRLFETIFSEPEFAREPACGLALQAYLRDSEKDLRSLLGWAKDHDRRFTVRLVKGAYWDYETVNARQKNWPIPVFTHKAETDANFEKLSLILLENASLVSAAYGTHNVRSIAYALAQAERLGVHSRSFEFQMLYGMADAIKSALLALDLRVREYCPVGELLPGMAYLVRRLLENTSNEGFLANRFAKGVSPEELLRNPAESATPVKPGPPTPLRFRNEPPTDFTLQPEREKVSRALEEVRKNLGRKQPLVINSKRVSTREWTPSLNPANQAEVLGYAARATVQDAEDALASARAAIPLWSHATAADRSNLIERLAALTQRDKAQLTALEILEAGKNWIEADADVAEAIDFCNFYAREMRALGSLQHTQIVAGETNVQYWWPRGAGVIISPWNFPLAILTGMTTAAVVAGNTVIIKPSEQTPLIAGRFMELIIESGIPSGVVNLLTGRGSEIGAHLVAHPKVDFIAFTGSKEVGLRIWESAGRTLPGQANLKKVVCEMGGKNALIIDSDADLDEAVLGVVRSAFGYQGQKCSALSRLIVLEDNYNKFTERLIAATASIPIGPPEMAGNVIGPVIDRAAQKRILDTIEYGKSEAKVAWQSSWVADAQGCYVPPVIFTDVPPSSSLFREEIFGPVLAVTKARDFTEALALANDSEFALTGGIYSRSPINIERAKRELVCGNLYINRPITGALVDRQPFGGFKMSGGGTKAGSREYLQNFLFSRVVTENCLRRGFAPEAED